jgi:hypothetical protein
LVSDRLEFGALRRCVAVEQVLGRMTCFSDSPETHHPARTLECVQLSFELRRRLRVFSQARGQLEDPVQTFAGFFEKECEQFVVRRIRVQIFVQFKRLTSTPRVPTMAPSAPRTATAMVKQGSSVKSES